MSENQQDNKNHDLVKIFTDGSVYPNPDGDGGWAYVMILKDTIKVRFGVMRKTTTNRAEMVAVKNAIIDSSGMGDVEIYSDSKYVVNGINRWCESWFKAGWPRTMANRDLWMEMYDAKKVNSHVSIKWIMGHDSNEYNEFADMLCNYARLKNADSGAEFNKGVFNEKTKKTANTIKELKRLKKKPWITFQ